MIGGVTSLFSLFKSKPKSSESKDTVSKEQAESSGKSAFDDLEPDMPKEKKTNDLETGPPKETEPPPPKEKAAQGEEEDQMAALKAAMEGAGAGEEKTPTQGSPGSPPRTPAVPKPTNGLGM